MKLWCKRISLVVLSAAATLLLGEVVVRQTGAGDVSMSRGAFHRADPDVGWVGLPGVDTSFEQPGSFLVRVRCNSRGLRNPERPFEKPPGIRRIVCLGDSFMWGYGVEDHEVFSSVLEDVLPDTECINLGANGYSTVQELIRLETEGMRYQPDWVILAFCWNDLDDNLDDKDGGRPIAQLSGDDVVILNRPVRSQWKSPGSQWLRHRSRLFVLAEHSVKRYRLQRQLQDREAVLASTMDDTQPKPGSRGHLTSYDIYAEPGAVVDEAWEVMHRMVRRCRDMAGSGGSRLLVLYEVDRLIAVEEVFRRFVERAPAGGAGLDPMRPERRLAEICASLRIPFVGTTQAFRAVESPQDLFLYQNGHWNARGHELAARLVAEVIEGS